MLQPVINDQSQDKEKSGLVKPLEDKQELERVLSSIINKLDPITAIIQDLQECTTPDQMSTVNSILGKIDDWSLYTKYYQEHQNITKNSDYSNIQEFICCIRNLINCKDNLISDGIRSVLSTKEKKNNPIKLSQQLKLQTIDEGQALHLSQQLKLQTIDEIKKLRKQLQNVQNPDLVDNCAFGLIAENIKNIKKPSTSISNTGHSSKQGLVK